MYAGVCACVGVCLGGCHRAYVSVSGCLCHWQGWAGGSSWTWIETEDLGGERGPQQSLWNPAPSSQEPIVWIQPRLRSQQRPWLLERTAQPSSDGRPLPVGQSRPPCGYEDRTDLRTPPVAGMKEAPSLTLLPCPQKEPAEPQMPASLEAEGVRDLSGQSTHKTEGFTVNRSADLPPLFLPLSSFSSFFILFLLLLPFLLPPPICVSF